MRDAEKYSWSDGFRRRSSDQTPEDRTSILVGLLWAALLVLATCGVLSLIGWRS